VGGKQEVRVMVSCDGPHCFNKLEWFGNDPESVPQSIFTWWTIVLADKQEFIFCSTECGEDWLKRNNTTVESPAEKQRQMKSQIAQAVDTGAVAVARSESEQSLVERGVPAIPEDNYEDRVGG
jgi:hypothetical protein